MVKSNLEDTFASWAETFAVKPVREYRFSPPRRWKFDFAWPERMVAVELEGGAWIRGRHVRPQGFINDCEKYNAAALMGWTVLRYETSMLKDMATVIEQVTHALKTRSKR